MQAGLRSTRSSTAAREALQKSAQAVTAALDSPEPRAKRAKKAKSTSADKGASSAPPPQGISRYYEQHLGWNQGYKAVAGVDEAGRGPLAGPVVAAACIIPPSVHIEGIDDSKKITEEDREKLYEVITSHPDIIWAVKAVDRQTIDSINILQATMQAMELAVAGLTVPPDYILVDGNRLPKGFDPEISRAITKGDAKVYAIAAASIIAKVTRDRMMMELHVQYPQYNFAIHKGYGVPAHVEAIRKHGPCPEHRRSFNPVKTWFGGPEEAAGDANDKEEKGGGKKGKGKTKKK